MILKINYDTKSFLMSSTGQFSGDIIRYVSSSKSKPWDLKFISYLINIDTSSDDFKVFVPQNEPGFNFGPIVVTNKLGEIVFYFIQHMPFTITIDTNKLNSPLNLKSIPATVRKHHYFAAKLTRLCRGISKKLFLLYDFHSDEELKLIRSVFQGEEIWVKLLCQNKQIQSKLHEQCKEYHLKTHSFPNVNPIDLKQLQIPKKN